MCFTQPCSLYTHSYVCLYTALFALHTFIYEYFYTVLLAITHINLSLHSRVRHYTHSSVFSQVCSPLHTFMSLHSPVRFTHSPVCFTHIYIFLHSPVRRYTHSYVFSQACSPLHTFVCLYTGLFAIAHIHISLHRPVCRYL